MARKKSGKKVYRRSRLGSGKNLLFFFVLVISFFSIFVAVNQLQKPQTIKQHADTKTSDISRPVWGCLGLGSSDVCTAVGESTFVSDPAMAECLVIEKAVVEPAQVEQGQTVTGTFIIKNSCNVGKQITQLTLKSLHSSNKIVIFEQKSTPTLLDGGRALTFTTPLKIDPKEVVGEWSASLFAIGPNNTEVPFSDKTNNIKYTVVEPCKGLEVSKPLSVDKGHVNVGETINGTITYKNPCATAYEVNDMLIQVKKPGTGNSTTTDDFSKPTGKLTIAPNAEKIISGALTIPSSPNPCGDQPTCSWTAVGSYQKVDKSWIFADPGQTFTVGAIDPVDAQKPENKIPAGETCTPGGGQLCADGYECTGTGTTGKCTQAAPKTPAGGTCDPNKGNTCVDGYECKYNGATGQCMKSAVPPATKPGTPNTQTAKLTQQIVYFDFDSVVIKSAYTSDLNTVIQFMKTNTTAKVTLEGHSDNVGTPAYNMDLGKRRAEAVKNYLVGKGIAANRFTVVSKGETEPRMSNTTPDGRARNRRVEIF